MKAVSTDSKCLTLTEDNNFFDFHLNIQLDFRETSSAGIMKNWTLSQYFKSKSPLSYLWNMFPTIIHLEETIIPVSILILALKHLAESGIQWVVHCGYIVLYINKRHAAEGSPPSGSLVFTYVLNPVSSSFATGTLSIIDILITGQVASNIYKGLCGNGCVGRITISLMHIVLFCICLDCLWLAVFSQRQGNFVVPFSQIFWNIYRGELVHCSYGYKDTWSTRSVCLNVLKFHFETFTAHFCGFTLFLKFRAVL